MTGGMTSSEEQVLIELAQWLARVMQYSAAHPACAQLADKTHRAILRALADTSPLTYGVLRDGVLIGEAPAHHPVIRGRLAPHLHERGVIVLRIASGVTLKELVDFVDILTMPVQALYDKGGIVRQVMERGIARVQVEELAHDVTTEEREAQRRRSRLREFFRELLRNLLAKRAFDVLLGEHLAELLEHPDIAVTILEEDPAGLAEAAAGLALVTMQEEKRSGASLAPKLRAVFLTLSPQARDRLLMGFPALVGEFRQALIWAFEAFDDKDMARMAFPSIRARAGEMDLVFYALAATVAGDTRRQAILRWVGPGLFDLPIDEPAVVETLKVLARPIADYDSFRRERECLREHAERALTLRTFTADEPARTLPPLTATSTPPPPGSTPPNGAPPPYQGRAAIAEVVRLAARRGGLFDRLCRGLPQATAELAEAGAMDGFVGIVRGLSEVASGATQGAAERTLMAIGASAAAPKMLGELETATAAVEGQDLEAWTAAVKLIVAHSPEAALDRLEQSDSRKMRRMILEALPSAGATLLPLLRTRLRSQNWFVVRNAVLLFGRCGASARELAATAHHPNEKVRMEIARALRGMPQDEAAMDIVVAYFSDPSQEVRQAARGLLRGERVSVQAIAALERVATDEQHAEDTRRYVIAALGRSPHDEAATALFKLLQPKGLIELGASSALREAAAVALRASPAPRARQLFEDGLASSVWRVRKACERAAGGGA